DATLYAAVDQNLGRTVLVRLLAQPPAGERSFEERARARAQIEHTGVVPLLEWGFVTDDQGERRAYQVFADAPTATLADRLASEDPAPWPVRSALLFGADVALALAELHERGIVAGSLAPSHLLVGGDGSPRLLDAGLDEPDPSRAEAPEVAA